MTNESLLRLGRNDVDEIVDLLSEAFTDYPVVRFVLDPNQVQYSTQLRRFIHFFVMARVHRHEFLLGVAAAGTLQGAALVSRPWAFESSAELDALREELWKELGPSARARYEAFGAASTFHVPEPHLHLNLIGVRGTARGKGYGRKLLESVHAMSRDDPDSSGVSLNTETETNVLLYRSFGYKVIGQAEVAPGLTSWGMFRPDAE